LFYQIKSMWVRPCATIDPVHLLD